MSDLDKIVSFLRGIGITVEEGLVDESFISGISIVGGKLTYDPSAIEGPGDLLHEAGHIATMPSLFRPLMTVNLNGMADHWSRWFDENPDAFAWPEDPVGRGILQAGETESIAWSYAAAVASGVDTTLPFVNGFEGGGLEVHDQVASGYYLGVHGLTAAGMTVLPRFWHDPKTCFPYMKRWVQV